MQTKRIAVFAAAMLVLQAAMLLEVSAASASDVRHLVKTLTTNGAMTKADDFNGDGLVNAVDLTLMKRAILAEAQADTGEVKDQKVTAITEQTKLIGRTLTKDGVTWLVHSGSAVECTVTGVEASVTIEGDDNVRSDAKYRPRYGVYVDGELVNTGSGLLQALEGSAEKTLKPGLRYDEELSIRNDGIPAYVRVIVHKYWSDEDGTKRPDLDSSLIKLSLGGSAWKTIETSPSGERTILYYNGVMSTGDAATFADGLVIDGQVIKLVHQTTAADGTVTTVYLYDGEYITIEVETDGVQTHNAQDAIRSAWGVDPSLAGA